MATSITRSLEHRVRIMQGLASGVPFKENDISKMAGQGAWDDDPILGVKGTLSLLDPDGDWPGGGRTVRQYWHQLRDRLLAHLLAHPPTGAASADQVKEYQKQLVLLQTRDIRTDYAVVDFHGHPVHERPSRRNPRDPHGDPSSPQIQLIDFNSNERRLLQGMIKMLGDLKQTAALKDLARWLSWGDVKFLSDFIAQTRAISNYSEALERGRDPEAKDHRGKVGITDSQKEDVAKLQDQMAGLSKGLGEIDKAAKGGTHATIDDDEVLKLKSGSTDLQEFDRRKALLSDLPAYEAMRKTGDLEELARLVAPDYKGPDDKGLNNAATCAELISFLVENAFLSKKLLDLKRKEFDLDVLQLDDLTHQERIVDMIHQRSILSRRGLHRQNLLAHLSRAEQRTHRVIATVASGRGEARWIFWLFLAALVFAECGAGSRINQGSGWTQLIWLLALVVVNVAIAMFLANTIKSLSVSSNRLMAWIMTLVLIGGALFLISFGQSLSRQADEQRRIEQQQPHPRGSLPPGFKFP